MTNKVIPNGNYKLSKRIGDIVYTSGITPKIDGKLIATGKITADADLSKYKAVAEQAIKNAISVTENILSDKEQITDVVHMTFYVNADSDFTLHSKIADFASDYLFETFGEAGIGTRAAVGVSSLPGDAPLEIQLITAVG